MTWEVIENKCESQGKNEIQWNQLLYIQNILIQFMGGYVFHNSRRFFYIYRSLKISFVYNWNSPDHSAVEVNMMNNLQVNSITDN